jgi:hypothetical protein
MAPCLLGNEIFWADWSCSFEKAVPSVKFSTNIFFKFSEVVCFRQSIYPTEITKKQWLQDKLSFGLTPWKLVGEVYRVFATKNKFNTRVFTFAFVRTRIGKNAIFSSFLRDPEKFADWLDIQEKEVTRLHHFHRKKSWIMYKTENFNKTF